MPDTYFVTNALPYANGPIHLGHMLEHIQSDIWVRFQRAQGARVVYVCGDDCHGTPVMIKAAQQGVTPEELIATTHRAHEDDLRGFEVEYDEFYSTHTPENRAIAAEIYRRARAAGYVTTQEIMQLYDPQKKMFLPDRFVKGTCPRCGARDQYGDSCEICGATYSPTELKDAYSTVSGAKPELRRSLHYFFDLPKAADFLHDYIRNSAVIPPEMGHKLEEWFTQGLKPWDISRDAPYFGFLIPDTADKYFYVWLDAPIGYLAALQHYCARRGQDYAQFVRPDSPVKMCHFIGKDILYFHALFWPALLQAAGMKEPDRIFVHGYVTVNGAKMSKSKGTFIKASTFLKYQNPESLRYYFASKLSAQVVDIDLSLDDFTAKVNADIVGKVVNLAARTAGFITKRFAGRLAAAAGLSPQLLQAVPPTVARVREAYAQRNYGEAVRQIMALADEGNRYVAAREPWNLAKRPDASATLQQVCSDALNVFRVLVTLLGPIMPNLARQAAAFLQTDLSWDALARPLADHVIAPFRPLYARIDPESVQAMVAASQSDLKPGAASSGAPAFEPLQPEITLADFAKVDLRVGTVVAASPVPGARKLLKLEIDLGFATRQVFAGIKAAYPDAAALVGRQVVTVANLAPREMKFGVSAGMVTAAGPGGDQVFLLAVDAGARNGDRVH